MKRYVRNTPTERLCPECKGAAVITRNDTNPHGYGPDPQCDYDVPCTYAGCFDGWIRWAQTDPLAVMRSTLHARSTVLRAIYPRMRERAMTPANLPDRSNKA